MKLNLFVILLALQVLDIGTTFYTIQRGATERDDTAMYHLFKWAGEHWRKVLIAAKAAFIALIAWQYEAIAVWAFGAMIALYVLVLWNNWKVIQGLRR